MLRGEKLTIGFFNEDITNYSCAWIESKTVSAFKYVIFKEDNVYWLMNYLINGEVEDIDAKPFGIQGEIETPKVKYCINRENWEVASMLFSDFFGQCMYKKGNCCE